MAESGHTEAVVCEYTQIAENVAGSVVAEQNAEHFIIPCYVIVYVDSPVFFSIDNESW